MKRIAGVRAATTTQTYESEAGLPSGYFKEPDATSDPVTPGTVVSARWANEMQEEVAGTITACGATLANGAQLPAFLGLKTGVTGGRLGNLNRVWYDSYSEAVIQDASEVSYANVRFPRKLIDTNSNATDGAYGWKYTAKRAQRIRASAKVTVRIKTNETDPMEYTQLIASVRIYKGVHPICSGDNAERLFLKAFDVEYDYCVATTDCIVDLAQGDVISVKAMYILTLEPSALDGVKLGFTPVGTATGVNDGCSIIIEELPEIL